jgi:ABC-type Fe3+-siderophore transport system permease subunit
MRIARSSRLYGIIAAAVVTAGCGLLYVIARSKLTALRDLGEGTADEIGSAVSATRLWLVIGCVMALGTVVVALLPGSDDN